MKRIRNKRGLLKYLHQRQLSLDGAKDLQENVQFTEDLIKRLGLEFELEGHQGCVNCLQWTKDGKYLASGSDDTNVILWDPFRHKQIHVIPTRHHGNIFSVKFVGTSNNTIATAAGDGRVMVQTVQNAVDKEAPLLDCCCHVNRVKRLATTFDEPSMIWSGGEDGFVMQFDMREKHKCQAKNNVLICLPEAEVKCITINPVRSHYLALGANDCYARLYDRRMIKLTSQSILLPSDSHIAHEHPPSDSKCVQYFAPNHLACQSDTNAGFKLAATYIDFNSSGTEMLVNLGGEQIYLFDINQPRHGNYLRMPKSYQYNQEPVPNRSVYWRPCCEKNGVGYDCATEADETGQLIDNKCVCYYLKLARKYHRRQWMGDLYNAAKIYHYLTEQMPHLTSGYIGLIKCLVNLGWDAAALQWLDCAMKLFPMKIGPIYDNIKQEIEQIKTRRDKENEDLINFTLGITTVKLEPKYDAFDYNMRYVGHCNTTTDIKEAKFLGPNGDFICAGSDDGIIFIWEKKYDKIVTVLLGDSSIVNCITPHPSMCFLASSGIDQAVKLWSPLKEDEEERNPAIKDINLLVQENQRRMSMDPVESMLFNMGCYRACTNQTIADMPTCRNC